MVVILNKPLFGTADFTGYFFIQVLKA